MENEILVSVLLTVYNGEAFLKESIESILTQTYQNIEFLIMDDGSTDSSLDIIRHYSTRDNRIKYFTHKNQGVPKAVNKLISISTGKYIARIDADDVALPNRIQKQLDVLETNPQIGIVGSSAYMIDESNNIIGLLRAVSNNVHINWESFFRSPFFQPSVMMRSQILKQHHLLYEPNYFPADDYDLWVRILKFTIGENIQEPLIKYRIHPKSVSSIYKEKMIKNHLSISIRTIRENFPNYQISDTDLYDLCREISYPINNITHLIKRGQLARKYFELWQEFKLKHGDTDLNTLERSVTIKTARMILFPPFQHNWLKGILFLSAHSPTWFKDYIKSLWNGIISRIKANKLKKYRHI